MEGIVSLLEEAKRQLEDRLDELDESDLGTTPVAQRMHNAWVLTMVALEQVQAVRVSS